MRPEKRHEPPDPAPLGRDAPDELYSGAVFRDEGRPGPARGPDRAAPRPSDPARAGEAKRRPAKGLERPSGFGAAAPVWPAGQKKESGVEPPHSTSPWSAAARRRFLSLHRTPAKNRKAAPALSE